MWDINLLTKPDSLGVTRYRSQFYIHQYIRYMNYQYGMDIPCMNYNGIVYSVGDNCYFTKFEYFELGYPPNNKIDTINVIRENIFVEDKNNDVTNAGSFKDFISIVFNRYDQWKNPSRKQAIR